MYLLGWSALASLLVLIALTPVVRYASRTVFRMSRQIPVKRDKRVSVVREMLQNIVAVKLNAWDDRFIHRASASRDEELRSVSPFASISWIVVIDQCPTHVP